MSDVATAIDLFSGCGGFSYGLLQAGFNVRLGIDNNAASIVTFDFNHSHVGARGTTADIRTLSGAEIADMAGLDGRQLDLLVGGPPCQPFSIVGKRQGLADDRGDLVFEFVRLLEELAPKAFVFENVPNFARFGGGTIASEMIERMERAGYAVSAEVLNAAHFGVPQMRKRFFVLGIKGNERPGIPTFSHGPHRLFGQLPLRTCRDVLDDLPDVDTVEAASIWNHEGTSHSRAMLTTFQHLVPGTRDPKSYHDRLHPDRPAYTLRAGNGNFSPLRPVHYRFDRVISVRESARLQAFPDHFTWPESVSRLQQYRQVGNAVPPVLAAQLGRHIAELLKLPLDSSRFGVAPSHYSAAPRISPIERAAQRQRYIRGASVGRSA